MGFGRLHGEPVGLHPQANFEMEFTRDIYTEVLTWLSFYRPNQLSVFIHPFTELGWAFHPFSLSLAKSVFEWLQHDDQAHRRQVYRGDLTDCADRLCAWSVCCRFEDHTSRAIWLGKQLALKVDMLKPFDKQLAEKVDAGEEPVGLMWAFRTKIARANAAKNWNE